MISHDQVALCFKQGGILKTILIIIIRGKRLINQTFLGNKIVPSFNWNKVFVFWGKFIWVPSMFIVSYILTLFYFKIWLLILPSSCYTFPCKLVLDQDNFKMISLSILITCLLVNEWIL